MHLSGCLGVKSFGLFGRTSINYCSYNNNIIPISLPKDQRMNISRSDAINFIKPEYVLNFLTSSGL
jgi:ADP-heptose:LPS heptosyltransferase